MSILKPSGYLKSLKIIKNPTFTLLFWISISAIVFWLINILQYWTKIGPGTPNGNLFDDAFMFIRYAKNFIAGHGFSWNPEDGAAYGNTSTAYLLLITALRYLTDLQDWQILVFSSFIFSVLIFGAFYYMIKAIRFQNRQFSIYFFLLIIIFTAFSYSWKYHAFTGMETMLSVFSNLILIISAAGFVRNRNFANGIFVVMSGYFTYLVRPDNGLYAVLFPFLFFLAHGKDYYKSSFFILVSMIILQICDIFLKQSLFGNLLPYAFYSKQKGFFRLYLLEHISVFNLSYFIKDSAFPYIIITAGFLNRQNYKKVSAVLVPAILTFIYYSTLTQIMGNYARFYLPALPFFIFSAAYAVGQLKPDHPVLTDKAIRRGVIVLVIMSIAVQEGIYSSLAGVEKRLTAEKVIYQNKNDITDKIFPMQVTENQYKPLSDISRLAKQLPAGTIMTASEHGYLAAQAMNVRIIDLIGLHNLTIAQNGLTIDYLAKCDPDIIWMPHHDYYYELQLILNSEYFRNNFDFYPKLYGYGIAIKRSSPRFNQIKNTLTERLLKDNSVRSLEKHRVDLDSLQNSITGRSDTF